MEKRLITAADVRELQQKTGLPLMEAKKLLIRQRNLEYLLDLRSSGTLEEKVDFLLDQSIKDINV